MKKTLLSHGKPKPFDWVFLIFHATSKEKKEIFHLSNADDNFIIKKKDSKCYYFIQFLY